MEEGGGASGTALAAAGATAQPREPPPPTALDVRADAHIKVPSACEIKKLKVPELKSLLSRLGQPDDGLKKALVDRLLDAAAAAADVEQNTRPRSASHVAARAFQPVPVHDSGLPGECMQESRWCVHTRASV